MEILSQLMGLLLLRHALTIGYGGGDNDDDDVDDPSAFFAVSRIY